MNLVTSKCVTAVKVSNITGDYLPNRSTLDIGVLGFFGIVSHKEHPPEVWSLPPVTPCIYIYIHTYTHTYIYIYIYTCDNLTRIKVTNLSLVIITMLLYHARTRVEESFSPFVKSGHAIKHDYNNPQYLKILMQLTAISYRSLQT